MIEGIETGYEEKFDFPAWEGPPAIPYLLASVPRSGSTYFSHLLWKTGCLGAPLEYLNFLKGGPYGHVDGDPVGQTALWRSLFSRRTSPNGAFGLKLFPIQMRVLQVQNPGLVIEVMRFLMAVGSNSKVIQLRRRDRTGHAISLARAMLSGIWRKEQEGDDRFEPEYSRTAVENAERSIQQAEESWAAMYFDLRLTPLELWHEDVMQDPHNATRQVAQYLEVEWNPQAAVDIPDIERQSQAGAKAWAQKHSSH